MLCGIVFFHFFPAYPVQHIAVAVKRIIAHDQFADLMTEEIDLMHRSTSFIMNMYAEYSIARICCGNKQKTKKFLADRMVEL